ncbi:MAG: hypothetical protein COB08_002445 [Rhodobacteraceae bacterium]|nr:hypothetical protein [Paracoccaceae bacterium]
MRRTILKGIAASILAVAVQGAAGPAMAQDAAAFYEGEKITWIVPYKPGGGYDEYARLFAPFLEKYTHARIEIENMPGAGGMRGANEIFNAPSDGLTIGIINGSAMVTNELSGIEGATYRVADYNFLGRVVADSRVLVVPVDSPYNSLADILASETTVKIGATGLGGSTYVDAVLVGSAFALNQQVIHGFGSSSDVRQALLRGDIDAMWGSLGSALSGVNAGDNKVIVHGGTDALANFPEVESLFSYVEHAADPAHSQMILDAWSALNAVGRPVAAPPGVPQDRVEFLAEAFRNVMQDPDFIAAAEDAGRSLSYVDGAMMAMIAKSSTDLTPELKALFVAAIRGEL